MGLSSDNYNYNNNNNNNDNNSNTFMHKKVNYIIT